MYVWVCKLAVFLIGCANSHTNQLQLDELWCLGNCIKMQVHEQYKKEKWMEWSMMWGSLDEREKRLIIFCALKFWFIMFPPLGAFKGWSLFTTCSCAWKEHCWYEMSGDDIWMWSQKFVIKRLEMEMQIACFLTPGEIRAASCTCLVITFCDSNRSTVDYMIHCCIINLGQL